MSSYILFLYLLIQVDKFNCSLNLYGGGELVQLESLCYQLHAVQISAVIIFKIHSQSFQKKVTLVFKKVSRKYSSCRLFIGPHPQLNTLRTGDADLRFYISTVQDG